MRAGVGAGLVEADAGDGAEDVDCELDADLDRGRSRRSRSRGVTLVPQIEHGQVTLTVSPGPGCLQVAAVVDGAGLDRRASGSRGRSTSSSR